MKTDTHNSPATQTYLDLLLSETPPPPASVRLDLTGPATNRDARHLGEREVKMRWDFFVRISRQLVALGVNELVLANLGDAFKCPWLNEAISFAKQYFRFPHVVLRADILSSSVEQLEEAVEAGIDGLIFNFNLSCAEWRERADACLVTDPQYFMHKLERVMATRELVFARRAGRCHIYVAQLGRRTHLSDRLQQAIAQLVEVADHEYFEWLPEKQDLLGVERAVAVPARDGKCHCWTPFTEAHVTADGFLTACRHDYIGSSTVADLNQVTFGEAWHSKTFQHTRTGVLLGKLEGTLCACCPIRSGYRQDA
jgi:hypothetical protein